MELKCYAALITTVNYCNTIKNWKIEIKSILTQYPFCFNAYSFSVEGGRGEEGGGVNTKVELIKKFNLQTGELREGGGGLLELLRYQITFESEQTWLQFYYFLA